LKFVCSIDEIKLISPAEVKNILDSDKTGEYMLIDVRQPREYDRQHLPGSRLIPLGELEVRSYELDKSRKAILYCRSGKRSMGGAILLCGLGFKDVYSMEGGILQWDAETLSGMPDKQPGFITGDEDIKDALIIAIRLEKGSKDFYNRAAQKVENENSKLLLKNLARFENAHMDKLFERYEEIHGKAKLPDFHSLQSLLDSDHMESGLKSIKALLAIQERDFEDELAIFETALEKEYLSYDFYVRMADLMENADTRTILHELAIEEKMHIKQLLSEVSRTVSEGE
jgi:rhodanese-related sulfurtransferase/rubrerythrin